MKKKQTPPNTITSRVFTGLSYIRADVKCAALEGYAVMTEGMTGFPLS